MSDQLRFSITPARFLAGALPWVPDNPLAPFMLPHHPAGLRRALWAIEELNDDRVAWDQYANLPGTLILEIARTTQRDRRRHRRK